MEMSIACFVGGVSRTKEVRVGTDGNLFAFCVCRRCLWRCAWTVTISVSAESYVAVSLAIRWVDV